MYNENSPMIQRVLSFFEHRTKRAMALISISIAVLLGILDFSTGTELHFLVIYLLPIALASWYLNQRSGIYVAIICSLVWLLADSLGGHSYSSPWIAIWNIIMRTGAFVVFSLSQSQLRARFDALSDLAKKDFLTGLPNGRAFHELTAREIEQALGIEPLTLAFIDLVGVKWINHRLGYATGDQMICTIAHAIRQNVPRPDLVGRIGGTSFAVLLPNTASEGANRILDQVQKALKDERKKYAQPMTFFISAVACTKAPRSIAELMHQAETQMTRMKGGTKDLLQIATVDSAPALN
jgi:diguanylate cyclase (GGDEF)-like protein